MLLTPFTLPFAFTTLNQISIFSSNPFQEAIYSLQIEATHTATGAQTTQTVTVSIYSDYSAKKYFEDESLNSEAIENTEIIAESLEENTPPTFLQDLYFILVPL